MEPKTYEPKMLGDVTAMQFNAWDGTGDYVKAWIDGLLVEEGAETYYGPIGDALYISNGTFNLKIETGQYVYLDEDGFHAIGQGTFEFLMRERVETT